MYEKRFKNTLDYRPKKWKKAPILYARLRENSLGKGRGGFVLLLNIRYGISTVLYR